MKKRLIPLLVLTLIIATAPAAMANHCLRCKPVIMDCGGTLNFGFEFCEWDISGCVVSDPCGDHFAMDTQPFAADFTVASVERLDEPNPDASKTLVASNETPQPATPATR